MVKRLRILKDHVRADDLAVAKDVDLDALEADEDIELLALMPE
jgi:hypothetical protein